MMKSLSRQRNPALNLQDVGIAITARVNLLKTGTESTLDVQYQTYLVISLNGNNAQPSIEGLAVTSKGIFRRACRGLC